MKGIADDNGNGRLDRALRQAAGEGRKVIRIPLCVGELMVTDGATTYRPALLDAGAAEHLGPAIEQMRIVFEGDDFGAEFRVKFSFTWSASGQRWTAASGLLLGIQSSAGAPQVIGAWYNTATDLGPLLRFYAETANAQVGSPSSGRVSAWLEVQLKT